MYIPEPGDEFHMYTEGGGLFQNTVYRCTAVNNKAVQAEYVAGAKPSFAGLGWFWRDKVSFWPVQPGYRDSLNGIKFAAAKALDARLTSSDDNFKMLFKGVINRVQHRELRGER
jgi:hypothetical protein